MLSVFALAWLAAAVPSIQTEEATERVPIDQVLTQRERSNLTQKSRYKDRIAVLRKAMERRSGRLEHELGDRNLAVIFRTLAELRTISSTLLDLSLQEPDEKERRHKEVKRLEIYLRKLAEQLESQKLAVPLENRSQFEQTAGLAEQLRDQLLQQLFGKAISGPEPGPADTPQGGGISQFSAALPAPGASLQRGLWELDKFTEKEYEKVQYAQKLVKRVEVFLEIAQARLEEIDRRRQGKEWEKEEPNPLEFYTYEDLLFGYYRSVEGVMVNIDEKARNGSEEEKDVRKALKKLKEKIDEFLPRLKDLEDLVRQQKDLPLLKQYRAALQSSEIARKGALYGLGAPED